MSAYAVIIRDSTVDAGELALYQQKAPAARAGHDEGGGKIIEKDLATDYWDILLKHPNEDIESISVSDNIKGNEIPFNIFMCWKDKKVPPMCKVNSQGFLVCYPVDLIPEEEELVI